MYVKINGPKDYVKGNTQSCKDLVKYLEKENKDKDLVNQEQFFNQTQKYVESQYVINKIDNNKKGLKEKDAKFYMLSVNPSEKELKHLAKLASGKDINHISQLTDKEMERYNDLLKDYTRQVMDGYAKNFNRGLTGNDLVYFAKVEQQRYFNGIDARQSKEISDLKGDGYSFTQILEMEKYKNLKESEKFNFKHFYENGPVKQNDLKPGLQSHIHIVVSRKDASQKYSLSPLANSRGSNKHQLNGKNVTVGFDRNNFANEAQNQFDKMYNYERNYQQSYEYYKFAQNPTKGLNEVSGELGLVKQALINPEVASKNIAIKGIDNLTNSNIASDLDKVSNMLENPENAKDLLVNHLEKTLEKLLPPEVQAVKKIAEKVIKPIVELGSGLEI